MHAHAQNAIENNRESVICDLRFAAGRLTVISHAQIVHDFNAHNLSRSSTCCLLSRQVVPNNLFRSPICARR